MRSGKKILIRVALALVIIIGALILYFILNADSFVEKKIRRALEGEPLKGHTIGFSDFRFSALDKGFELDSVFIVPDTAMSGDKGNGPEIRLNIGKIKVSGIGYLALLTRKALKVEAVTISGPAGSILFGMKENKEGQPATEPARSAEKKKKPFLKKMSIHDFELLDGYLRLFGKDIQDSIYSVEGLHLGISGIKVNLLDMKDPVEAISFGELMIKTNRQVVHLPGGFYDLQVSSLDIDETGKTFRIDSLLLIPQYSKKEFGYRFGRQMDRFDVSVREILIREFDMKQMLLERRVLASAVEVSQVKADIYRDKNIPRKNEKIKPLLNELILKVKMPLAIDTVYFSDAYVMYGEVPEESSEPGVIFIEHFDVLMENVTNMPERIAANSNMELTGYFMLEGVGPTDLHMSFPLDSPQKRYSYVIELHDMPLPRLNPMLTPSANIDIDEGMLVKGRFEITATSDSAWGKAYMQYYNLDMEILKKKPKDKDHDVNKFLSKIANTLIHSENPSDKTGVERVGLIAFERDKYKSQVGFLVKPMIQGMIRVIIPVDTNVEKIEHLSPKMGKKEERISEKEAEKLQKLKEKKERKERKRAEK